uniref:AAA-ATPase ASD n=1 Tax=Rhizophora mucronata TaxID=61149 RepID=A0A2P2P5Q2_RHIMU
MNSRVLKFCGSQAKWWRQLHNLCILSRRGDITGSAFIRSIGRSLWRITCSMC